MLTIWLCFLHVFYCDEAEDFSDGDGDVEVRLLAFFYKVLGDFFIVNGVVKWTYGSWSMWLSG